MYLLSTPTAPAPAEQALSSDGVIINSSEGGGPGGGPPAGVLGNEGVGNGLDAPPPGHDYNFNDAFGSVIGAPGAQGGDGYQPSSSATSEATNSIEPVLAELVGVFSFVDQS